MSGQPEDFDSLSLSAEVRVDAACLRFEAAWKAGRRPCLEDFLTDSAGAERLTLLRELILLDASYRRRLGETPRPEDYREPLSRRGPELDGRIARRAQARDREAPVGERSGESGNSEGMTVLLAPATDGPILTGTVNNYDDLQLIGRGGMGVVYGARDVRLNRRVALKMIRAGEAEAAELDRFRTEAEVVAQLRHPNIVQIYEVGDHRGRPFIALEYVEGGNLKEKLSGTPLPPREAARLLETLARAVQAAHARHIVHRDLKPANVMLTADGTPKITDFGLAKRLDEAGQTQSGAVVGTPSYMAPEQAEGRRGTVGPTADVYALGAILYECLTGRPPFLAATTHDTLRQVATEEPVPPRRLRPDCPRDLETICLTCLRKEVAKRYASAEALAEDLLCWQAGEPIRARPVGRLERAAKWVGRNPVVATLLALVVLAVAAGSAGIYLKYLDAVEQAGIAQVRTGEARTSAEVANSERAKAEGLAEGRRVALEEKEKAAG